MRYALIQGGLVANVVEQDSLPAIEGQWVECNNVEIGDGYNGLIFTKVTKQIRHITLGALQKRLGVMNVFAIDTSTNPVCIALRSYLNRLSYIDLDDPDVSNMLGMLMQAGQPTANPTFPGSAPITAELIAAVINTPVADIERP